MAAIVGTTGSVIVDAGVGLSISGPDTVAANANMRVTKWSGSIDQGTFDSTGFLVVKNARTTLVDGLPVMTGTFEGFLDATNTILVTDFEDSTPTAGAFILTASDTGESSEELRYTFSGWITAINITVGVGEINRFTASFKSTGAITSEAV